MGSHQHHDRFCGDILLVAAFLMKLNPFFLLIVAKLVCLLLEFFTDVEWGVGDELPPPTQIGYNFHVEQSITIV